MSSHHIVREKQEPALLILGLDFFDHELLGQLLEWSPTLIATTQVAEQLNAMGIKVDRVLGNDVGEVLQSDVSYISVQGYTPLEVAMKVLIAEDYAAVNVITDDFDLNNYVPYVSEINVVVFYQQNKTYAITSGFTKWLPAGDELTILSESTDLVTSGLSGQAENKWVTTADGVIKLEFSDNFVFISESI